MSELSSYISGWRQAAATEANPPKPPLGVGAVLTHWTGFCGVA